MHKKLIFVAQFITLIPHLILSSAISSDLTSPMISHIAETITQPEALTEFKKSGLLLFNNLKIVDHLSYDELKMLVAELCLKVPESYTQIRLSEVQSIIRTTAPRNLCFSHYQPTPIENQYFQLEPTNIIALEALSPNKKRRATIDTYHAVQIHNAKTGALESVLSDNVYSASEGPLSLKNSFIAFSADGSKLIVVFDCIVTKIFDTTTGKLLYDVRFNEVRNSIACISDSPCIWDGNTHRQLALLSNAKKIIKKMIFSPDGSQITLISHDEAIICDTVSGKTLFNIPISGEFFSYSPDGRFILFTDSERFIKVLKTSTFEYLQTFANNKNFEIEEAQFTNNGENIVVLESYDRHKKITDYSPAFKIYKIWNVITGKLLASWYLPKGKTFFSTIFSPDGQSIFAYSIQDDSPEIWDAQTGKVLHKFGKTDFRTASFSPDGKKLTFLSNEKTIKFFTIATRTYINTNTKVDTYYKTSHHFSSDCSKIASYPETNDQVNVHDTNTGKLLCHLTYNNTWTEKKLRQIALSPNGTNLAIAFETGILIIDIATGKQLYSTTYTQKIEDIGFLSENSLASSNLKCNALLFS